jgi:hypothetical protein
VTKEGEKVRKIIKNLFLDKERSDAGIDKVGML